LKSCVFMAILKRALLFRRIKTALAVVFISALLVYAAWPWLPLPGQPSSPRVIVFYGFSILGEVMNQEIFPAFQREWQKHTGNRVEFVSSFAGSGTVTNQLIMGVPAHMALLSLESDAERLAEAGVTKARSWYSLPCRGVVNRTPFIILVRPGNPKQIHAFHDLARPGVKVVHPDPLTSGGANWAIVAEYGAGARAGGNDPEAGFKLLLGIWRNVVAQASSARAARTQFDNGFGDALITYEQEVLWDLKRGNLRGEIIYPRSTILSEHTLVEIERNIDPGQKELISSFVEFLWTGEAQREFVESGFRSIDDSLNGANPHFKRIEDPFYIQDFGGWGRAKREILDGVWRNRVLKELGK